MAERYRPQEKDGGHYFDQAPVQFIDSGCTLLNCILSGRGDDGWALGRCINLVGDKSTGKTLLAIEACVNFVNRYPDGTIWYREAEAAFDLHYAAELGLPVDDIDFGPNGIDTPWNTVEDVIEDLEAVLKKVEKRKKPVPGLYIIDSLDALTTRAALGRKIGEGSYNLEKPKLLSQELFSKLVRRIRDANICLLIVSQIRDRIGITFGEKKTRSGGTALEFYASQIVWLSHLKTMYRKAGNIQRATEIQVKARCKKNKIGKPLRDCTFFIRFGFGVDDLEANLDFLAENKGLSIINLTEAGIGKYIKMVESAPEKEYRAHLLKVREATIKCWNTVEKGFLPRRPKYRAAE